VPIASHLPGVGLAGRDQPKRAATRRVDHQKQPPLDLAEHAKARLAVVEAAVGFDHPIRVEEHPHRISEVETALGEAGVALGRVPLKLHRSCI